jgi:hypothetical protein
MFASSLEKFSTQRLTPGNQLLQHGGNGRKGSAGDGNEKPI